MSSEDNPYIKRVLGDGLERFTLWAPEFLRVITKELKDNEDYEGGFIVDFFSYNSKIGHYAQVQLLERNEAVEVPLNLLKKLLCEIVDVEEITAE